MNIDDLQKQLLDLQGKYDSLSSTIKEKDELIEGLRHKNEESATKISDYQEKIMTLRDMNTDLFLRVSQPIKDTEVAQEVVPEPEPTTTIEDILW